MDNIVAVEPDLLQILSFETLQGNLYQTLQHPYQAALTESTAEKMFGTENPIGKTFKFKIDQGYEFTVTAVIKDLPANTCIKASMLVSYSYKENFLKDNLDGWTWVSGTEAFITVPTHSDTSVLMAQLKNIADKYINQQTAPLHRSDFELQPLSDIHFSTDVNELTAISKSWLWFFGLIGLTVLILACINFVNLSTAQALSRAKEVGIRKSIGANRGGLITQFLAEAWVLTFISGVLAVALTQVVLPAINTMLNKGITFNLSSSPILLISLVAGLTITGLLAGVYPAWIIARFNPTTTLKAGALNAGGKNASWLRKGLLVAQFAVSACLLMVVILMAQQVDFLRNKNLGFNKDNVVLVDVSNAKQTASLFSSELSSIRGISGISFSTSTPSSEGHWGTPMSRISRNDPGRKSMTLILADDNYEKLYDLKLLAGRTLQASDTNNISSSLPTEKQVMNAVVNEKLVSELEFKSIEAAIGQRIFIGMNAGVVDIVGVIANFNDGPLSNATTPVLITPSPDKYGIAGIKIEAGSNIPQSLAAIESAWKNTYPEGVFSYKFLDEQIDAYYKSESRLFNLFKFFASVAMLISCLGLFGLAAFNTQSRVKEIGIRKTLGATVNSILILVSKDFIKLVLLALIIATP
ncbi:MAG: FtsX-like permease family protein, partial [Cytophagales bacterium]